MPLVVFRVAVVGELLREIGEGRALAGTWTAGENDHGDRLDELGRIEHRLSDLAKKQNPRTAGYRLASQRGEARKPVKDTGVTREFQ